MLTDAMGRISRGKTWKESMAKTQKAQEPKNPKKNALLSRGKHFSRGAYFLFFHTISTDMIFLCGSLRSFIEIKTHLKEKGRDHSAVAPPGRA